MFKKHTYTFVIDADQSKEAVQMFVWIINKHGIVEKVHVQSLDSGDALCIYAKATKRGKKRICKELLLTTEVVPTEIKNWIFF